MKYWIRGKVVRLIDHYYIIIVVISIAIIMTYHYTNRELIQLKRRMLEGDI